MKLFKHDRVLVLLFVLSAYGCKLSSSSKSLSLFERPREELQTLILAPSKVYNRHCRAYAKIIEFQNGVVLHKGAKNRVYVVVASAVPIVASKPELSVKDVIAFQISTRAKFDRIAVGDIFTMQATLDRSEFRNRTDYYVSVRDFKITGKVDVRTVDLDVLVDKVARKAYSDDVDNLINQITVNPASPTNFFFR